MITYKLDGKTKTESIGWASEGHKASEAFDKLCYLKKNQKSGGGPRTLAEMRELGQLEREQARRDAEAQRKLDVSFKYFFDDTYFPDAETRWKSETARKAEEHVNNWIDPVTGSIPMRDIKLSHVKKIRATLLSPETKSPGDVPPSQQRPRSVTTASVSGHYVNSVCHVAITGIKLSGYQHSYLIF